MRRPDPRGRVTAHRPLLAAGEGRRGLSNVGGPTETAGDPGLARIAAGALAVRAGGHDATLTHPFHAYPARLHPEVARHLVGALARAMPAGERPTVVDPFCGSGTVLVEAMAAGLRAEGADLSPLAVELARVKTRLTLESERRALVACARAVARDADALVQSRATVPAPAGEAAWFAPHTLAEVAALRHCIAALAPGFLRDAARMLLSSVLVKVSRQATDSDARAVDKPVAPWAALRFFARKAVELAECLAALAHAVPSHTPAAAVRVDDARALATFADASADAVISSPPYANTYDYVDHHARRYAWLDLDAGPMAAGEIGAARWFDAPAAGAARFARELDDLCRALHRVMRPGALAWLVIADAAAGPRALYADAAVELAARAAGLELAARASQARPTFDRTSGRAFARGPKREHLLVLARP